MVGIFLALFLMLLYGANYYVKRKWFRIFFY
jgi:hypothetical protein